MSSASTGGAGLIAVDTSALVAIAWREPGYEALLTQLGQAKIIIGGPTLVDTHMVLTGRRSIDPFLFLNGLLQDPLWSVIPCGLAHFHAACDAFERYGKGGGHPAQLNFGDCLSYAVAKVADVPLLYAGRDFARTDIAPALKP
jgi:ribonuclease VapC